MLSGEIVSKDNEYAINQDNSSQFMVLNIKKASCFFNENKLNFVF